MEQSGPLEVVIQYTKAGKHKACIVVTAPDGTSHTATVNMADEGKRGAFRDTVVQKWPGVDPDDIDTELDRIAAAVCGGGSEGDEDTQRDRIVRLAREKYRFGRTLQDSTFAVPKNGPNIARMLSANKGSLRAELAKVYCDTVGKAPGGGALSDAMLVLEGDAMAAEPEVVHLRLGRHGDEIVLDLGDTAGRAVVITAAGWTVVNVSPVLFRRTSLTGALPVPVRGGSLEHLRAMLNVAGSVFPLALGWLVAAFIPDIEHPIVLLGGQQDAGKSTTARNLGGLVDPSPAALRSPPRDLDGWSVSAVCSWVVVIDNISVIPEWLSDALCRAVTGDGLVKRSLYSNEDPTLLVFQRCLVLTSIDAGGLKGDLGRRLIQLELVPVVKARKRPPRLLKTEYEAARPGVLGALLDVLSRVLREMPGIHLEGSEGLADFEQALAAMDKSEGTNALDLYRAQWSKIAADVVESDNVALAVKSFAEENCVEKEWCGTASELLDAITPEELSKGWPTNPRAFGGLLRRLAPPLLAVGVEVVPPGENDKTRRFRLSKTALTAQPPEKPSSTEENAGSPQGGPENRPPESGRDSPNQPDSGGSDPDRPGDSPPDRPPVQAVTAAAPGPSGGTGGRKRKPSACVTYGPDWGVA